MLKSPQIRSPFPSPLPDPGPQLTAPVPILSQPTWMGDISIHFSSPSSFSSPYSGPSCANGARVLRFSCCFSGPINEKERWEKKRKREKKKKLCESEGEKVSECQFLAGVLLSAQFSRPHGFIRLSARLRAR